MTGKRDYQVVGNAALQPYEKPKKPIKKKKQVRQNEEINAGSFKYVLFLAFIIVLIIISCVCYLNTKQYLMTQTRTIESLEFELTELKRENDARLENINNSIDLNMIKEKAINEYGMHYPTEEQIIWYSNNPDDKIHLYEPVS